MYPLSSWPSFGDCHWHVYELLLKVADIPCPGDLGLERRCHLALVQCIPIDGRKEAVRTDFGSIVGPAAQARLGLAREKPLKQGLGDGRDVLGVGQVGPADTLKEEVPVLGVEGRQASEHLVGQGAQGVPVHRSSMAALVQQFGGQVFRGAAHGARREVVTNALFAQSEVRQLRVALGIQQHVLRLQVAKDDVQAVQVLQRQKNLTDVKPQVAQQSCAQKGWQGWTSFLALCGPRRSVLRGSDGRKALHRGSSPGPNRAWVFAPGFRLLHHL